MSPAPTQHVEDRLHAYLDGELPAEVAQRVRAHCAICPRCARILERLASVRDALQLDRISPAHPLWPGVARRLAREARPPIGWALAAGAAAAAFGVALGLLIGTLHSPAPLASTEDPWTDLGSTLGGSGSTIVRSYVAPQADSEGATAS